MYTEPSDTGSGAGDEKIRKGSDHELPIWTLDSKHSDSTNYSDSIVDSRKCTVVGLFNSCGSDTLHIFVVDYSKES